MKRVKMNLSVLHGTYKNLQRNQVYDLPDSTAKEFESAGYAEILEVSDEVQAELAEKEKQYQADLKKKAEEAKKAAAEAKKKQKK